MFSYLIIIEKYKIQYNESMTYSFSNIFFLRINTEIMWNPGESIETVFEFQL